MLLIVVFLLLSCTDKPSAETSVILEEQIQKAIDSIEKNTQQEEFFFNVRKNSITQEPIFKSIDTRYPLLQPIADFLTKGYIKGDIDKERADKWITLKTRSCYILKYYNKDGYLSHIYILFIGTVWKKKNMFYLNIICSIIISEI